MGFRVRMYGLMKSFFAAFIGFVAMWGGLFGAVVPKGLKPGDGIAIVFPASFPEESEAVIGEAANKLRKKGFKVKIAGNSRLRHGYLSGTDKQRASALMAAFKDPEIKAIWCYRCGYGCPRMLDRLDYKVIKENPKILIGMSDITALHAAVGKEAGVVTFLGPNVKDIFGPDRKKEVSYSETELWRGVMAMTYPKKGYLIPAKDGKPLKSGLGKGELAGGNLSLVVSLIGTPWEIDTKGKILVLEEVNEPPYKIDRMLNQLKLSGHLDDPAGVILASWKGCQTKAPESSLSLNQVFEEYFGDKTYPVLVGFPSGHIEDQTTLPLGAQAELNSTQKTLRILEDPVTGL